MKIKTITKTCKKCNIEKEISDFHTQKNCLHGVNPICKLCRKHKTKIYYIKNKESILKKTNAYNQKNMEKVLLRNKKWQLENREYFLEYHRNYNAKYIAINKKKLNKISRQYYLDNKSKMNRERAEYAKKQYKEDFSYKMKILLRSRIRIALQNNTKNKSTLDLLGCTIQFFKDHIEKRFQKGMTWDNYGFYGWHIDHIRPCASFDLSDPEEQNKCFHYSNLQPLWAEDNLRKSDKWEKTNNET
jgi:hypothetical protein